MDDNTKPPIDTEKDSFDRAQEASFDESATESTAATQPTVVQPVVQPQSKKKWLPWAIAGGAVLLVGGVSAYYFGVYQNPNQVLYDAYSQLTKAQVVQAKGAVTLDSANPEFKLSSVEYGMNYDNSPGIAFDTTVVLTVDGKDYRVSGKGVYASEGDLYFRATGLSDIVRVYLQDTGSDEAPASFYESLGKLEDTWVKVTPADIKESDDEAGKAYQCFVDYAKKHRNDDPTETHEIYRQHPFISVKENLGVKDGRMGMRLNFDEGKFKAYQDAIKDTPASKELDKCFKDTEEATGTGSNDEIVNNTSVTVWVNYWNHRLERVEYNGTTGSGSEKLTYKGDVAVGYDTSVKVVAPSDTITWEQFNLRLTEFIRGLGLEDTAYDYDPMDDQYMYDEIDYSSSL